MEAQDFPLLNSERITLLQVGYVVYVFKVVSVEKPLQFEQKLKAKDVKFVMKDPITDYLLEKHQCLANGTLGVNLIYDSSF